MLGAAAILSFSGLAELADMVGIDDTAWTVPLAWLFPVCTDAGMAVSTAVWLSRRHHPDAERFACRLTWSLLALTVAGNAAHQGLAAAGVIPPWWVAVLVGAIPPGVVGAVVHLAVLVGRAAEADGDEAVPPYPGAAQPSRETWEEKRDRLLADGAGRVVLMRELQIQETEARELARARRNGASP